ncbi:hypothetical protein LINPERHAP2_LOCUS41492 [Linum perenne]
MIALVSLNLVSF